MAKSFGIATDYSFYIQGWHIPKNAAYGTFTGYKKPLKWVVPNYPRTTKDTIKIFVWSGITWIKAPYSHYKKLYNFVVQEIAKRGLVGKTTKRVIVGNVANTFQSNNPNRGKKQKITALKTANKAHWQRADNGNSDRYCTVYKDGQAVEYNRKNNIIY